MSVRIAVSELAKRLEQPFPETDFSVALSRLPNVTPPGPWVAGGSVRGLFARTSMDSDFDFFFSNADQASVFTSAVEVAGALLKSKNDKNSTWIIPASQAGPEIRVQAVTFAYFESMQKVIESFDFTICQFAFDGTHFEVGEFSLWDVARKRIVPARITFGVSSLRRLLKYGRQGYTICGGALADVMQQIVDNPSIIHAETQYID